MDIFNNLSPMTILIGVLVLWFFIGMVINSISESKKPNDDDLKGGNTKHSRKNRKPTKRTKENGDPAYFLFFYIFDLIIGIFSFIVGIFSLIFSVLGILPWWLTLILLLFVGSTFD